MKLAIATLATLVVSSSTARADDNFYETAYSCSGLGAPAIETSGFVENQLARWHELATHRDSVSWRMDVAFAADAIWVPADTSDAVRLQHEILEVAREIDGLRRAGSVTAGVVHAKLMVGVRKTAKTAEQLDALGPGAYPRLGSIFGGAAMTQRATSTCGSGNGLHNARFAGLLQFRPMRTGTTRALVATIVAFDRDGAPHITPIVEGIEIRFGMGVDAPACVVHAGHDGELRPVALADVEQSQFVFHHGKGLGCKTCHSYEGAFDPRDLDTPETLVGVDKLRDAQIDRLARHTWAYVNEPVTR